MVIISILLNKLVLVGNNAPAHASGTISDGTIPWIWIERLSINEMFKKNLFVAIGKNSEWTNENVPDDAEIHDINDYDVLKNVIALKRVTETNFRLAIRRYNWTSEEIYSEYDDKKDPLAIDGPNAYQHPFYVFDENNIYKCLNNNNGAKSTVRPSTSSTIINTSRSNDGYVWKYMGTIDSDAVFFLTKDYIPVRYKNNNDNSGQWSVQNSAVPGSISTFRILKTKGTFESGTTISIIGGTPEIAAQAYTELNIDKSLQQILVDPEHIGKRIQP